MQNINPELTSRVQNNRTERDNIRNMHIEVQVALNFVISYLYNKLPRRRVNIFGEELEKALKHKFQGHWYPEKPFKVSIYFYTSTICKFFERLKAFIVTML